MDLGEGGLAFEAVLHPVTGFAYTTFSGLAIGVEALSLGCFINAIF